MQHIHSDYVQGVVGWRFMDSHTLASTDFFILSYNVLSSAGNETSSFGVNFEQTQPTMGVIHNAGTNHLKHQHCCICIAPNSIKKRLLLCLVS